ncbi:MAG TPA: helix-turn-helix domain-containing protein [Lysobacter sp.]
MANTAPQKKPADQDWHWADVMAALKKRGWSLRQVGIAEGYPDGSSLGEAARKNYPKAEAILAAYIGVDHPKRIWPSRYDAAGNPNRRMGPAPMRGRPPVGKATTRISRRNPQKAAGA